jgi:NADH:ubiquinone oxidoreductase subunit E
MSHTHSLPFSLVGRLEGYTFSKGGKIRRLLLETSQGVHSIKVTHVCRIELLRSILNKKIQQGSWLAVSGRQKVDQKGVVKHFKAKEIAPALVETALVSPVVSPVVTKPALGAQAQGHKTKILICRKSDCSRRGSAEFQAAVETVIEDRHLGHQVCVKAVGCLNHCGKGPVMAIGKEKYKAAEVRDVERFLEEHFAPLPEPISAAQVPTAQVPIAQVPVA